MKGNCFDYEDQFKPTSKAVKETVLNLAVKRNGYLKVGTESCRITRGSCVEIGAVGFANTTKSRLKAQQIDNWYSIVPYSYACRLNANPVPLDD